MKFESKATIKNRFDIKIEDINTGETKWLEGENIVLDAMWSRLVNFQSYFTNIHFGTGTGTFTPTRTGLFTHLGTKTAVTELQERALPTSKWVRKIVLNPEEYVGATISEVGVAYSATAANLVTHASIQDAEGNPITLTKTDTQIITIFATIFMQLGEIDAMYGGKWRWVQPLANNELLNYLMGGTYPTQQFKVGVGASFANGVVSGSLGQSDTIGVSAWVKNVANKKVTTPVTRLGTTRGNGEIKCIGLGSTDTLGIFRGQFPIVGVFESEEITENIGVGDGVKTGFNPLWTGANIATVKIDGTIVNVNDYDVASTKKGTDLFAFKIITIVTGTVTDPSNLTNNHTDSYSRISAGGECGFDVGEAFASSKVDTLRAFCGNGGTNQAKLYGSNNPDFSGKTLLATLTTTGAGWFQTTFEPVAYKYYVFQAVQMLDFSSVTLLTSDDQITFITPPLNGAVVTTDYALDYIPKDINHVLDLQCAIQYGEGI